MKEFRLQRKREEIGKEKAEAYILHPQIHPRSTSIKRDVEDLFKFRRKRDQKIEVQKHNRFQEQMEECTFQPTLKQCSVRSATIHKYKVHDRLYTDASHRRASLKADQDARNCEWNLSSARQARSRSPQPPKVALPSPKSESKMPLAPPGFRQFMRSLSLPPKTMSTMRSMTGFSEASTPRQAIRSSSPSRDASPGRPFLLSSSNFSVDTPRSSPRQGPRASASVLGSMGQAVSMPMPSSKSGSGRRRYNRSSTWDKEDIWRRSTSSEASQRRTRFDSSGPPHSRHHHKVVWNGGKNTVTATAEFMPVLQRCQPQIEDDEEVSLRPRLSSGLSVKHADSSSAR